MTLAKFILVWFIMFLRFVEKRNGLFMSFRVYAPNALEPPIDSLGQLDWEVVQALTKAKAPRGAQQGILSGSYLVALLVLVHAAVS